MSKTKVVFWNSHQHGLNSTACSYRYKKKYICTMSGYSPWLVLIIPIDSGPSSAGSQSSWFSSTLPNQAGVLSGEGTAAYFWTIRDQTPTGARTGWATLTSLLPRGKFLHSLVQSNPGSLCAWLCASQFDCPGLEFENMNYLLMPPQRLLPGPSSYSVLLWAPSQAGSWKRVLSKSH